LLRRASPAHGPPARKEARKVALSIQESVGNKGANKSTDVKTVQELLNLNIAKIKPVQPLAVDGDPGPLTIGAIEAFQSKVVGMTRPDGRVDPRGKTLDKLNEGARATPKSAACRVVFQHRGEQPPFTSATAGTDALYESQVSVSGTVAGTFRGSIYPDDLSVRGRLKDGQYDIYLGFHKRQGHSTTAKDLVARTDGFRAALIVNADRPVPVLSEKAGKTTSECIHVHNGYRSKRYSDGCPTLHPDDWIRFIELFLDAYPAFSDWTEINSYVGKKIGILEVKG
jgi:peptidoglycan hydrolase-like protein with peptidoglycan-binding domain